ncbi:alpha/beta fold hydrolase [Actinoplanes solisilvae]|uniref:alpha/beta fold hydrolase n=1 Tax=Actinoplanes solisilvae TaxID=2486853 RepID=UPI000FD9DA65|nr:alpha/beta hydrolase [Actinoplanes solisilvae]
METVTSNGIEYVYRRQGEPGGLPLVMCQHFRGNLDNWDPALLDALAAEREVIVFDNVGVGGTSGRTPSTVAEMAAGALEFVDALGLARIDLLGYSLGGFVAQELTLVRPDLVRRLVLAATAPQGAPGMHGWVRDIIDAVGSPQTTGPDLLHAFFTASAASQQAGKEFLERFSERTTGRDTHTSWQTRNAHYDAVVRWGMPNFSLLERLQVIDCPVFVANGDDDRMILPRYSHVLAGLLPNATLKLYPDAAHGFLFQHHAEFAADVHTFLDQS